MRTPFFTKKATKKSLDELRKIMPVLSEGQQREYVGRSGSNNCVFDGVNDCWWRVMAYLQSGGTQYSGAWDSWHIARDYKGYAFDPTNILFTGNAQETAQSILSGTGATGTILVYRRYGSDSAHAVIVRGDGRCSYSGTYSYVYCPQSRSTYRVFASELSGAARINVDRLST